MFLSAAPGRSYELQHLALSEPPKNVWALKRCLLLAYTCPTPVLHLGTNGSKKVSRPPRNVQALHFSLHVQPCVTLAKPCMVLDATVS